MPPVFKRPLPAGDKQEIPLHFYFKMEFLICLHAQKSSWVWWVTVVRGSRGTGFRTRIKCQKYLFPEMETRPEWKVSWHKHYVEGQGRGDGVTYLATKDCPEKYIIIPTQPSVLSRTSLCNLWVYCTGILEDPAWEKRMCFVPYSSLFLTSTGASMWRGFLVLFCFCS